VRLHEDGADPLAVGTLGQHPSTPRPSSEQQLRIRIASPVTGLTGRGFRLCTENPVATDVPAARTVLGRRNPQHDGNATINLDFTCLGNADFTDANLAGAHLGSANFVRADLVRTKLGGAHLGSHGSISQVNTWLSTFNALPCTRRSTSIPPGTISDEFRALQARQSRLKPSI
jgi:hypothetical protein